MRYPTAKSHDHRPVVEPAATDHASVQQYCHWALAHKLHACRVCTGFRVDELGLAHLVASPASDRSHGQSRTDGSAPWLASAATWRR